MAILTSMRYIQLSYPLGQCLLHSEVSAPMPNAPCPMPENQELEYLIQRKSTISFCFIAGIENDFKDGSRNEALQDAQMVVCILAVAKAGDDVTLGFGQNSHDRPRSVEIFLGAELSKGHASSLSRATCTRERSCSCTRLLSWGRMLHPPTGAGSQVRV